MKNYDDGSLKCFQDHCKDERQWAFENAGPRLHLLQILKDLEEETPSRIISITRTKIEEALMWLEKA